MDADIINTLRQLVIMAPGLLIAITFHEAAHGFVANRLGDPTAKALGRLSLNPLRHIDPFGTVILPIILHFMIGFPFGQAKPVPINPNNFRSPSEGMAISAAAGPVTNMILAIISIVAIHAIVSPLSGIVPASFTKTVLVPLYAMLRFSAMINVVLAILNMMPIPPLDGGRVAVHFLPYRQANALSRLEPYGFFIVLALLFVLRLDRYIFDPFISIVYMLTRI